MNNQIPDDTSHRSRLWLYAILTLVLAACLWAGWRDVNPWIPQDEVRQEVRLTVRWVIQVLVQYVLPAAIIVFFSKAALSRMRGKQRGSRNES